MKKLLILLLIASSSATFCTLRFDRQTRKYRSDNAPRNVNQDEYNEIMCDLELTCPQGILNLTAHELVLLFGNLRAQGTPAALQVIRDIEEAIKMYKEDLKRIQNL